MITATIDIGTNTVLLLIVQTPPHPIPLPQGERGLKVICDEARITRLGEGLHEATFFRETAQTRVLSVLHEYKQLCETYHVEVIKAVGTAAFRKAKNATEFVEKVRRETGIAIEIISGDREAELSYISAAHDFPDLDRLVVLDIGGGSTEIISAPLEPGGIKMGHGEPEGRGHLPTDHGRSPRFARDDTVATRPNQMVCGKSLDLGSVVLTESIIHHDPITPKEFRSLQEAIDRKVDSAFFDETLKALVDSSPSLVGLAGTVTTLSAMVIARGEIAALSPNPSSDKQLSDRSLRLAGRNKSVPANTRSLNKDYVFQWDGAKVQGSILTDEVLEKMIEMFRKTTVEEKKKIPGMVAGREDTILAGTLILIKIMDVLGSDRVIVSDRGLRYGLVYGTN